MKLFTLSGDPTGGFLPLFTCLPRRCFWVLSSPWSWALPPGSSPPSPCGCASSTRLGGVSMNFGFRISDFGFEEWRSGPSLGSPIQFLLAISRRGHFGEVQSKSQIRNPNLSTQACPILYIPLIYVAFRTEPLGQQRHRRAGHRRCGGGLRSHAGHGPGSFQRTLVESGFPANAIVTRAGPPRRWRAW